MRALLSTTKLYTNDVGSSRWRVEDVGPSTGEGDGRVNGAAVDASISEGPFTVGAALFTGPKSLIRAGATCTIAKAGITAFVLGTSALGDEEGGNGGNGAGGGAAGAGRPAGNGCAAQFVDVGVGADGEDMRG